MRVDARVPLRAAAACGAAFMVLLGCAYTVGPVERLDAVALHGLSALRGPWFDPVAQVAAHLADPLPLLVMLTLLFGWGWALDRRRQAFAAVAMVAAANVTTQILKVILAHPRVQLVGGYQLGPEAFPSGHATAAMSLGLAAVLVSPARHRVAVACMATAYVVAVSTSLLVLSWHFPSDVLGGLLVASSFFFCAVASLHASTGRKRAAARGGTGLAVPPRLGEAALVAAAAVGLFALLRAEELLSFARLHTVATATALAIMAACGVLLASATLIADEPR